MSIQSCFARSFCVCLTVSILAAPKPAAARDGGPQANIEGRVLAGESPRTRPAGGIVLDRLSKAHRRLWREIEEVVVAADASGQPRSATLRRLWDWAQASPHALQVEMVSPSSVANGKAGEFRLERVDPAGLSHVAVIQLCPENIRRAAISVGPSSVRSFVRFEGLDEVERYVEVLAHELAHAEYVLENPERLAELDAAQQARAEFLSSRERLIKRLAPQLQRRLRDSLAVFEASEVHAETVEALVLRELVGEPAAQVAASGDE